MNPVMSAADLARPVVTLVSCAMDEEVRPFLDALPEREGADPIALLGRAKAWRLQLPGEEDRELVLVRSGIGLVAAASALTAALAQVRPDAIISAGTTGGLGREIEVGDVCASTALAYTDADATAFGYAPGQTPGQPESFSGDAVLLERLGHVGPQALRGATASSGAAAFHAGRMLAGNSFVTAANVGATRETFPDALSTDMESTALAQVAVGAGIPFVSVRGVSDLCGPEAGQDFHIAAEEAAARSAAVVLALLSGDDPRLATARPPAPALATGWPQVQDPGEQVGSVQLRSTGRPRRGGPGSRSRPLPRFRGLVGGPPELMRARSPAKLLMT